MSKALFNIAYTLPSPPSNLHGNDRADYIARRNFYNMTAEYNYFSYALDKKKVVKNRNAEDYYTKSNTNEGLFNLDGSMSSEDLNRLKKKLAETKSIIWHGFISFDQETTKGFDTQEKAIKFMRQTFREFLRNAGLKPDNIELYAALHDDTPHHHHIHFAFFEKEQKRRDKNGVLGYTRRGKIDPKAIDNYLVSANMHLSEHGDEYYTARDAAMARLREVKKEVAIGVKCNQTLNGSLFELISKLPKEGRLQYRAKPMEQLRPAIDRVANLLIMSDEKAKQAHIEMLKQFARIESETRELVEKNKLAYVDDRRMSKKEIENAMNNGVTVNEKFVDYRNVNYFDKLKEDYAARVGNVVLGLCKQLEIGDVRDRKRRVGINDKGLKIGAKRKRKRQESLLSEVKHLLSLCSKNTQENFIQTVQQNEREIERNQARG